MKIRVERQGDCECALASLAAVSGKSLEEIRRRACQAAEAERWSDVCGVCGNLFWRSLTQVGRDLGLESFVEKWKIGGMTIGSNDRIPKKGRGVIIIESPKYRCAHAMPYQAGLVYDPNDPKVGLPLDQMMKKYHEYTVRRIVPVKGDSLNHTCPQCGARPGRACKYPSGYIKAEPHAARKQQAGTK